MVTEKHAGICRMPVISNSVCECQCWNPNPAERLIMEHQRRVRGEGQGVNLLQSCPVLWIMSRKCLLSYLKDTLLYFRGKLGHYFASLHCLQLNFVFLPVSVLEAVFFFFISLCVVHHVSSSQDSLGSSKQAPECPLKSQFRKREECGGKDKFLTPWVGMESGVIIQNSTDIPRLPYNPVTPHLTTWI